MRAPASYMLVMFVLVGTITVLVKTIWRSL